MDRMIRAITADAAIQIAAVQTTEMVEKARNIHRTLPLATAALGRTLTITSIMGNQLKVENGSVTVQVRGNGPLGTIVCVADSEGYARGYLQNPALDLPLRPDGKLNVGAGVGYGHLMVIKDIGLKDPVTGTVELVNGEIAEDITRYFVESEQIPSACALGVLVNTDQSVRQAGGYLVQLMPGAKEADIDRLEQNIAAAGAMTAMLDKGMSLEDIVRAVLDGFEVQFLEESPVGYRCNCSEGKVTRALVSLGVQELNDMADEEKPTEITCQFCDHVYTFAPDELRALAQTASKK
ncbi:MAG: Hsp33 family molecular chaperone HslO [Butyricicoccus pullicaecorum]|nr:Hsp33 family molecular chaperone HslO [Butyricicoccus pullicaecorum]